MRFEVKSGENLAAIVKAFPMAQVRALITRPKEDCWAVFIPDENRPPISHQVEWEDDKGNRFIVNADFATACVLFDVLKNQTGFEVLQRQVPLPGLPEEDERPVHSPPPESVVDLGSAGAPVDEDFGKLGTAAEDIREGYPPRSELTLEEVKKKEARKKAPRKTSKKKAARKKKG